MLRRSLTSNRPSPLRLLASPQRKYTNISRIAMATMSMTGRSSSVGLRSSMRPRVAVPRRSLVVVANEKQGKGGEEGGVKFDKSVYGTVAGNANFALLGSALTKAGLGEVLKGPGPFTVFAPNDDAFADAARALKVTKIELMNLPNLGDILKYHVIKGQVMSADLKEGMEAETLLGKKVKVTLAGGAKINGKKIKKADVKCTNGVVHAIEAVLIPQ